MAAQQIPNLSTFRRGRGRSTGLGRGAPSSLSDEDDKAAKDRIVQQTDQDASVSRLSAVEIGYLIDPFAKRFVSGPSQRTYVRTKAIDDLVHRFLSSSSSSPTSQRKQIISLGAGSDTRFFRLQSQSPPYQPFLYHELDFPTNTAQKITTITSSLDLLNLIPGRELTISDNGSALASAPYHIHPVDLRTLSATSAPPAPFKNIDPTLPTLIISECCLIYLTPALADSTATYFTQTLFPPTTPLGLILYEPINPHSAFGKVMVRNLATRGIVLQTLHKYDSLEAQRVRLREYGLRGGQDAKTVDEIWEQQ
ncbi:MAG: hypothetical protein Q9223_004842, partial [Gallowayella weberi]